MNIPVMPKSIISIINYQSDVIVSKQLLKKPNGTVTLYAFDKDFRRSGGDAADTIWHTWHLTQIQVRPPGVQ